MHTHIKYPKHSKLDLTSGGNSFFYSFEKKMYNTDLKDLHQITCGYLQHVTSFTD